MFRTTVPGLRFRTTLPGLRFCFSPQFCVCGRTLMINLPTKTCTYIQTLTRHTLLHSKCTRSTGEHSPAGGRSLLCPVRGVRGCPRCACRLALSLSFVSSFSAATPPKERVHSLCFTCRGRSRFRRVSFASVLRIREREFYVPPSRLRVCVGRKRNICEKTMFCKFSISE